MRREPMTSHPEGPHACEHLSLHRGGEATKGARQSWEALIRKFVSILELRTEFIMIEKSHLAAKKKSNVLSKIVIPRTLQTITYIKDELEEMNREEFFRMKKIIQVKTKGKQKAKNEKQRLEPKERQPKSKSTVISDPETEVYMALAIEPQPIIDPVKSQPQPKKDPKKSQPQPKKDPIICQPQPTVTPPQPKTVTLVEKPSKIYKCASDAPQTSRDRESSDIFDLGTIVTEIRELTKVVRTQNDDGTITEEKTVMVIKKEIKSPLPGQTDSTSMISSTQPSNSSKQYGSDCDDDGKVMYQSSDISNRSASSNENKRTKNKKKDKTKDRFIGHVKLDNVGFGKLKHSEMHSFDENNTYVESEMNTMSSSEWPKLNTGYEECIFTNNEKDDIDNKKIVGKIQRFLSSLSISNNELSSSEKTTTVSKSSKTSKNN